MRNVTMDDPLTTQEIYDELFNFRESLKQLTDQFGELANGIMLSLAKTERNDERGMNIDDNTIAEAINDIAKWRTWSHTYDNACMDGTLEVKVEDATKIGRVLITDDKHRGGLYYPDEDEGDLISKQAAIEALGEEPPVWCDDDAEIAERNQWRADIEAIKSVPSSDRPKGEWKKATESIWQCSLCDAIMFTDSNYCPNCGARMKGADDERP